MKRIFKLMLLLLMTSTATVFAQVSKDRAPELIKSKNFTFFATTAIPQNSAEINKVLGSMQGGSSLITLDPGIYQLTVKNDTLIAYLPYYGQAYSTATSSDPNERGIKFTSKDFSYQEVRAKRDGWQINIATRDVKENQQITLNINANGYASLIITGTNRSTITFNGYVDETKKPGRGL